MSGQSLKVLSVCTSDSLGGAARAAYRIYQGVRGLGVDSRMFVKTKCTDDANVVALDEFVPRNVFYKAFDWVRHKCKNKIQHRRWNQYPERENVFMSDLRGTTLHGALRNLDYDILHLHWINGRFISLKDLPHNKPIVWTLHDSWPFCGVCHYFFECNGYQKQCGDCPFLHSCKKNDLSHRVWRKKAKLYNHLDLHIVSPSRWLADCAQQSSLLGCFPVTVIPNCLDAELFRPLNKNEISPKWLNSQEKRFEIHFILYGAMNAATDKRKGFANLLAALTILEQKGLAGNVELIVFGATESNLNMDVNIPVIFVGYLKDTNELVSLYNCASVMVVPSLSENLSCTIMESLSCGTPVVAYNVGGNGDMIEHKVNGYLAQNNNAADLAEGIHWCIDNNANNQLGKAGRDKVLKEYTYNSVCQQYIKLYESLDSHY